MKSDALETAKPVNVTGLVKWALPKPSDRGEDTWAVNLLSDPADYHACLLARMGFSIDCISRQTGLSKGQVSYRLKKAKIKPSEYRNGSSDAAGAVLDAAAGRVARLLNGELRKVIDV